MHSTPRRLFWAYLLVISVVFGGQDAGPSFSCAYVTSQVNKLICATPALAALDRDLANVFNNMRGQPIDQKQLRRDEDAWVAALQRDCSDVACIQSRYEARVSQLRDQSLRVASPAAYAETRPFPAPEGLLAEARSLVGKQCDYAGFALAPRFLNVILAGGVTVVREKEGVRFAFLTVSPAGSQGCVIEDVVVLPTSAVGDRFLQCSVDDPPLAGFGVRNAKTHGLDAFWSVDAETHKIERVPMGVLAIEKAVRCQQPEAGE